MVWKAWGLVLTSLLLIPSAVSADDASNLADGRGRRNDARASAASLSSPNQRQSTFGFDADSTAGEYNSLDRYLDAAFEPAGARLNVLQVAAETEPAPLASVQDSAKTEQAAVPAAPETFQYLSSDNPYQFTGCVGPRQEMAARLGWWGVDSTGDPTKVGEYQGLGSSIFWDTDWLSSDGRRTIDLTATGLDNETTHLDMSVYGPSVSLDVDFKRYLHRLDHDPLTNFGALGSGEEIIGEDLQVGDDYAIRVEDMKYVLKGRLTEHTKGRVNFRVLRKFGERQANTVQHCANFGGGGDTSCHVLSQRQRIDWLTVKVEPVIETKIGPVRVEYSRPMRFFSQNDQLVTANYGDFVPFFFGQEAYAVVPDSVSQTDRIKLAFDLGAATDFYGTTYIRDTRNKSRDMHRKSYGCDLRLTNRSWDRVKLTAHATFNDQNNEYPPFLLPEEEAAQGVLTSIVPAWGIRQPIDYFRRTIGADASWYPFPQGSTLCGFSLNAGTEYGRIDRKYATWVVQDLNNPPGPVIDEDRTDYVSGNIGTTLQWSPSLETFVRYKIRANRSPLYGVDKISGFTNTNLPDQEDLVEVGGTWMPSQRFLASATVGLNNRSHDSSIATFEEDNYPMTYTVWYAPTRCWSLSAGYGYYSNWIDQNISFPSDDPMIQTGDIRRWSYGGRGEVISLGSDYAYSDNLQFVGGIELVHSRDAINPLDPWPDLPYYFDEVVDRTRVTTGIDWQLSGRVSTYFRYVFEDYEDKSVDYNSGSAHMFLTGLSALY